jgi:hypothetical protein
LAHELVGSKEEGVMPFEVVLDATRSRVMLVTGKGALSTWWFGCGQRRKLEEPRFLDELGGKPDCFGVYASGRLSLRHLGKVSRGKPRRKPELGNPTFRDCRGARGNVALSVMTRVHAPRLYPDPIRASFLAPFWFLLFPDRCISKGVARCVNNSHYDFAAEVLHRVLQNGVVRRRICLRSDLMVASSCYGLKISTRYMKNTTR